MSAMAHGRFNFRNGGASRVARAVGAANEGLHVTTTCATTVRTDSSFCVFTPSFCTRSPPVRVLLDGNDPSGRSAAFREHERLGAR